MFRKIGIPIFAVLGLFIATIVMVITSQHPPVPPIENPPPKPPYTHYVAGSGIIEANSLNINIGTAITGIVEELFVEPGDITGLRTAIKELIEDKTLYAELQRNSETFAKKHFFDSCSGKTFEQIYQSISHASKENK